MLSSPDCVVSTVFAVFILNQSFLFMRMLTWWCSRDVTRSWKVQNLIYKFEFSCVFTEFKIYVKHTAVPQSICEEHVRSFQTIALAGLHVSLLFVNGDFLTSCTSRDTACNRFNCMHSIWSPNTPNRSRPWGSDGDSHCLWFEHRPAPLAELLLSLLPCISCINPRSLHYTVITLNCCQNMPSA